MIENLPQQSTESSLMQLERIRIEHLEDEESEHFVSNDMIENPKKKRQRSRNSTKGRVKWETTSVIGKEQTEISPRQFKSKIGQK